MLNTTEPTAEERDWYPNLIAVVTWPPSKEDVDPAALPAVAQREWENYWSDYRNTGQSFEEWLSSVIARP